MNSLLRKLAAESWKYGKKLGEVDPNNPMTADTVNFLLDIAKEIIKPF